jgi:exodeoxyribonuclease-3
MKLYSWNVNGIRAVLSKGALQDFIAAHDPDILCLQETKAERGQVELDLPQYHEHFFSAVKKGYSGTAIFSKVKPLRYIDGFPDEIIQTYHVTGDTYGDPNAEGRVIAAEFDEYWVVTCYTPNSKGDLSRLSLRYDQWDRACLAYLQQPRADQTSAVLRRYERRTRRYRPGESQGKCRQTRLHR